MNKEIKTPEDFLNDKGLQNWESFRKPDVISLMKEYHEYCTQLQPNEMSENLNFGQPLVDGVAEFLPKCLPDCPNTSFKEEKTNYEIKREHDEWYKQVREDIESQLKIGDEMRYGNWNKAGLILCELQLKHGLKRP